MNSDYYKYQYICKMQYPKTINLLDKTNQQLKFRTKKLFEVNDGPHSQFGVECIPKQTVKFIGNKNIKINISRMQAYDSILCGYFCIEFIDFMFKGKNLTDFTRLFSLHNFLQNDPVILDYFLTLKYNNE